MLRSECDNGGEGFCKGGKCDCCMRSIVRLLLCGRIGGGIHIGGIVVMLVVMA